jgi:hypothetical protein
MKKGIWLCVLLCAAAIAAAGMIYLNAPLQVVESTLDHIRLGKTKQLPIPHADADKIKEFYRFVHEHNLDEPQVSLEEAMNQGDQRQIVAFFHTVDYGENHAIKGIYGGSMVFTLSRHSLLQWEIEQIEVLQPMQKQ